MFCWLSKWHTKREIPPIGMLGTLLQQTKNRISATSGHLLTPDKTDDDDVIGYAWAMVWVPVPPFLPYRMTSPSQETLESTGEGS